MALPAPTRLTRAVPSAGATEDIRGVALDDEVEGGTSTKLATIVAYPAIITKIGHQLSTAGGHVGKEFPDDGGGVLPTAPLGGGSATLKLSSSALQGGASAPASLDPRTWLCMIVSGAAAGQVRQVTAWNAATQTITVNRAWGGAGPAAGDKYRLLFDLRYRSNVHLSTEYSADTIAATFRIVFYDWAVDGGSALRKPRRDTDLARTSAYTSIQITDAADIETVNRYLGETITVGAKPFLGAKVRLVTAPGTGDVDLFAAAT